MAHSNMDPEEVSTIVFFWKRQAHIPKLCKLRPPPTGKPLRVQPPCHPLLFLVDAGLKSCGEKAVSGLRAKKAGAKGWSVSNVHNKL